MREPIRFPKESGLYDRLDRQCLSHGQGNRTYFGRKDRDRK